MLIIYTILWGCHFLICLQDWKIISVLLNVMTRGSLGFWAWPSLPRFLGELPLFNSLEDHYPPEKIDGNPMKSMGFHRQWSANGW